MVEKKRRLRVTVHSPVEMGAHLCYGIWSISNLRYLMEEQDLSAMNRMEGEGGVARTVQEKYPQIDRQLKSRDENHLQLREQALEISRELNFDIRKNKSVDLMTQIDAPLLIDLLKRARIHSLSSEKVIDFIQDGDRQAYEHFRGIDRTDPQRKSKIGEAKSASQVGMKSAIERCMGVDSAKLAEIKEQFEKNSSRYIETLVFQVCDTPKRDEFWTPQEQQQLEERWSAIPKDVMQFMLLTVIGAHSRWKVVQPERTFQFEHTINVPENSSIELAIKREIFSDFRTIPYSQKTKDATISMIDLDWQEVAKKWDVMTRADKMRNLNGIEHEVVDSSSNESGFSVAELIHKFQKLVRERTT